MAKYYAFATILGGLPVWVSISSDYDDYMGECYEVEDICWIKRKVRNGRVISQKPGKPISRELWEKARSYDPDFRRLAEYVMDE